MAIVLVLDTACCAHRSDRDASNWSLQLVSCSFWPWTPPAALIALTAACAANAISGADSTWDCVGEIWASWIVPPLLAPLFAVLLPGALLALLLQAGTPPPPPAPAAPRP